MEEMKTTKTTKKSVVEKEEAPTTSVVARPKRRCTLAAAKAFRVSDLGMRVMINWMSSENCQ